MWNHLNDGVKWLLIFLFPILSWLLALTGCMDPQYAGKPTEAKNSVSFEKTTTGAAGGISIGADTKATIDKFDYSGKDGSHVSFDKADFEAMPSQTIGSWTTPMEVYNKQIESAGIAYAAVATANWQGFASAISAVAPIAGPFLQGMAQAKLAKAQRPGLIGELADLVVGQKVSSASLKELDVSPDILAEVDRLVEIRLSAKIAELKTTTQPAEPGGP
jgi:hypothetical protein